MIDNSARGSGCGGNPPFENREGWGSLREN